MNIVCPLGRKYVPAIIDAVNGDGPKPDAVTVGGTVFYFVNASPGLKRHEEMHVVQQARFAPGWASWLPLRVRAWLGLASYSRAYLAEYQRAGYVANKFEVEARKAESP